MSKEYNGTKCPHCGSKNIEGADGYQGIDNTTISVGAECGDCGAYWTEIYNLVGIVDLGAPSETNDS